MLGKKVEKSFKTEIEKSWKKISWKKLEKAEKSLKNNWKKVLIKVEEKS